MHASLMSQMQQFGGAWILPPGAALRLPAARLPRYLAVIEGRIWLTRSAGRDEAAPDVWLAAGERWHLPAGAEVVVEGWPSARFALLEAALRPRFSAGRVASWLRRWRERARPAPAPAPCA